MSTNAAVLEIDPDLMQEFLAGSEEHVAGAEGALIALEKNPGSMELINETFRHFHSLKGDAASVGINEIRDLAHEMESMLDELRTGARSVTPELLDMLLEGLAALTKQLRQIEAGESATAEDTLVRKFADALKAPHEITDASPVALVQQSAQNPALLAVEQSDEVKEEKTYIVFRSGGLRCAINVEQSNEIIASTHITPVPNVGKSIQGVINLRGNIIPVINLARRLGVAAKDSASPQILILIMDGTRIGLLVEEVYEICSWSDERLLRPTSIAFDLNRTFVSDVVVEHGVISLILNLPEITRRES